MSLWLLGLLHAAAPGELDYKAPGFGADGTRPESACTSMAVPCALPERNWAVAAALSWSKRPLLYHRGEEEIAVIDDLLLLHVGAALRLGPFWFDLDIPGLLLLTSDYQAPVYLRMGDPSLQGRIGQRLGDRAMLGLYGRIVVPTGTESLGLGEEGLSGRVGILAGFRPWILAGDLGVYLHMRSRRYAEEQWLGDMLGFQAAFHLDLPLRPGLEAWLELGPVRQPQREQARGEWLLSLGWKGWTLGAGTGIFSGPGSPAWRLILRGSLGPASKGGEGLAAGGGT